MRRRFASWLGGIVLVLIAGFLAVFGRDALSDPVTVALLSGFAAAAALFVVGGTVDSVAIGARTLPWNVLLGTGDVVVALLVILSSVRTLDTGDTEALLVAGAAVVGGGALAWFGLQTARDSRHVDLEATPSRARLVGIAALAVVSMAGGLVAATVV